MSKLAKSLAAAAGNAGGDAPNVEKVFSTYLYEGTGSAQDINNGINLGDFGVGTSTEFDGTNDYLSRTSDLTGNTDSKTFTFSAWVYHPYVTGFTPYFSSETGSNNGQITIHINSAGYFSLLFNRQGTQTSILKIDMSGAVPKNTWTHILISIDMANTSNRYLYINDVLQSPSWSSFIDESLNFTNVNHGVLTDRWSTNETGRIAHVFLDYTYRDLSTASNRRLFIDANGGSTPPTTLSALNPIMYLPMTTAYSIGENLGTGGDFTSNGSPTIIDKGTEYVAGSGEGGLVWIKSRAGTSHVLQDTERGVTNYIRSETTAAEGSHSGSLTQFNTDGFTVGDFAWVNGLDGWGNGVDIASWTFRKAPRFFDVVTYTGNGVAGRNIAHDLTIEPGMIIYKALQGTGGNGDGDEWWVDHRGITEYKSIRLDSTEGEQETYTWWNDRFNSETFNLNPNLNWNGIDYVAYLFAHDPNGEDDDGMIACGSYVGNTTTFPEIDLGWEPQYILIKNTSSTESWAIFDTMRGIVTGTSSGISDTTGDDPYLYANSAGVEVSTNNYINVTATGFACASTNTLTNWEPDTYIYMAIRAPMMKEPESGTEVFAVDNGNGSDIPAWTSGFPVDMVFWSDTTGDNHKIASRLTGARVLETDTAGVEVAQGSHEFDYSDGFYSATRSSVQYAHMFKRAKGFFDVVAYKGGTAPFEVKHSLGVPPEMIWIKNRITVDTWAVYHGDATKYLVLNSDAASANSLTYLGGSMWSYPAVEPTSTVFTLGGSGLVNNNSTTPYIAYLFATLPGVSKVGSYTGTGVAGSGTPLNIDCGFSNGARFVLIKRTDDVGGWYFWDTTRGIVTGNDSTLRLDAVAGENTSYDAIDPYSAGFTINATGQDINNLNAEYIFLAIA